LRCYAAEKSKSRGMTEEQKAAGGED